MEQPQTKDNTGAGFHGMLAAAGLGTCWGGVRARVCAYVLAFASPSLYSVFRPGQASRASASVSSRVFGRRGVAPAPRL